MTDDSSGPAPAVTVVDPPLRRHDPGVVVEDLVKRYRKNPVPAVDKVAFSVARGEILGLLGPNGAGKTTTIGVLTTRVRPDSGRAFVAGVDVVNQPVAAKSRLAVVPQRNNLDRSLSIRQNLLFHAAYHGVPKADRERRATALLDQFGLVARQNDRVDMFSGGQSQRVMIARALMHAPEVLFLDEPTTGLDPAARLFVWDRIRELRQTGVTIVITTHDMDEAAALADRVGIMDHGHLLVLDTPDALTRDLPGSTTLNLTVPASTPSERLLASLRQLSGVEHVEVVGNEADDLHGGGDLRLRLYLTDDTPDAVAAVATLMAQEGWTFSDFRLGHHSLEDVFLQLTGRLLR
ncbi:MAG TPA: ABC transporter ATP-binding protein [Acidimicrobiales bacterium]|jgi:ABC-2 type transport system ATP-binding protein|nr:ABC transporter ATP-binding protein [Acidimicrobiales bacterium]